MKTFIRTVRLARWFPPADPLAVKIARLCIVREDLVIECRAIQANQIGALDKTGKRVRRIYFLRSCIRSLQELSSVIQSLLIDPRFKSLLRRQNKSVQAEFLQLKRVQSKVGHIVKDVRNDICGHVSESAVRMALQRTADQNPEAFGFLEVSPNLLNLKFAHELIAEILLKDVSSHERQAHASEKYASIREFLPSLGIIQRCITMYLEDRGFWE
jgi:hypothetical protein